MLANGPPWTNAGVFSSVCTRLGASASRSSTVIAPCASRSRARDRLLVARVADDDVAEPLLQVLQRRRRGRRSPSPRRRRRCRSRPGAGSRWRCRRAPTVMSRSARSFMSSTRFQVMRRTSMPSSLPWWMWLSISAASRLFASCDRGEVAGEVQVDVLHRHDLGVAAAGRAALHAEHRARATARAGRSPPSCRCG